MGVQTAAAPAACRGAGYEVSVFRWLWGRSGRRGRKLLRTCARLWLERRSPVAVPVGSGEIVLNGAGDCARSLVLTGAYEPADEARFRALLRSGMTVFDIGANFGIYTLLAAERVGAEGAVYAFEPVPEIYPHLEETARRSGLTQVRPRHLAVGDRCGEVPFYLNVKRKYSDGHSLAPSDARTHAIPVPCTTLDAFVEREGIRQVDAIKIDIEGGELLAFRGARELRAGERAPLIQSEIRDCHCAHFGYTSRDLKRFLQDLGYTG